MIGLPALAQANEPSSVMDQEMHGIAGTGALNCGRVEVNGDDGLALKCARRAIRRKQPFFVRFDLQGIDSFAANGFAAGGAGDVYLIIYGSGYDAALDDGHDLVTKCAKPVRILKMTSSNRGALGYRCAPQKNEQR